ncbi:YidC/Oxa1 family membrane protein insertase [Candidatus Gracilibacteria bacterium]|nr:YidC/Oxa1 family membrane protein insertase [Candidatus Gracilibacteria bacterium]
MSIFTLLFTEILYRPIFNLLVVFLDIFGGNLGIAIILLTLAIRFLMIKQSSAGNNMQKGMADLQPKLHEIQEKYKDNPEMLSKETMKVFKQDGKGPLKGCLMLLIQLPVFIGLYFVVRKISANEIQSERLYSFFRNFGNSYLDPENIKTTFLGMDLLTTKNITLTILAAVFTFLQMKLTTIVKPNTPTALPGGQKAPDMNKMMGFMGIFMTFIMGSFVYQTQAAVGLYIVTTTLFSSVQYLIQYRALLRAKRQEYKNKGKGIILNN